MDTAGHPDLATADGHDRHVPSGATDILSAGHEGVYAWAAGNLVQEGMRFLDFGCGTGYGSIVVRRAGASYDGVDGSAVAIDYARENYGRPDVRFFVADLMVPLPAELASHSYDVVFSSEVLEHVIDPFAFVAAMAAHMRPDGVCFIGTPNRVWSKANMPGGSLLAASHVMEFTPSAFVALLRDYFEDVSVMFRRLPTGAEKSIVPTSGRPRVVRAAAAFAREMAPSGLGRYRRTFGSRAEKVWSPDDITWIPGDTPDLDATACVGLAAVCRGPRPR